MIQSFLRYDNEDRKYNYKEAQLLCSNHLINGHLSKQHLKTVPSLVKYSNGGFLEQTKNCDGVGRPETRS